IPLLALGFFAFARVSWERVAWLFEAICFAGSVLFPRLLSSRPTNIYLRWARFFLKCCSFGSRLLSIVCMAAICSKSAAEIMLPFAGSMLSLWIWPLYFGRDLNLRAFQRIQQTWLSNRLRRMPTCSASCLMEEAALRNLRRNFTVIASRRKRLRCSGVFS